VPLAIATTVATCALYYAATLAAGSWLRLGLDLVRRFFVGG